MVRVDGSEKELRGGPGALVVEPGKLEVEHAKKESSETALKL